ncbi:MAG: DUF732 domain-containing protein [Actinomycetia bacterium]|nr:DUF732 domain-containing protein [Actinomycetes bacterium]
MKSRPLAALAAPAAALIAAMSLAAPAHAEPGSLDYLSAQADSGLVRIDPGTVAAIAQTVCPLMAERGQTTADAAAKVADATGMSLGPATMFTGLAISMYCPRVVSSLGDGKLPVEIPIVSSILGG